MATLLLGLAGTALGGPIGGALGAIAGGLIDQKLFGQAGSKVEGPRLSDLNFLASTEGAVIPEVWAKMRVSPQVIWATKFREEETTETTGGKGGPEVETTSFTYSASFAIGLARGEITGVGRVWADGKIIRLGDYNHRIYRGTADQGADPKIVAVEGAENTPAFRDTAYIVFEDMPLAAFGNRPPQITVETIRRPPTEEPVLEDMLRAVTLIPATTEFGYATTQVSVVGGVNEATADNSHVSDDVTDFVASLDQLMADAPDLESIALVVAWHGTDLRVGTCQIRPKVESAGRETSPIDWRVGPVTRSTTQVVSQFDGKPAAGGAPSDRSIYEAIREISNRGLKVTLYPFILMDVASDNALPNPYGGASQPPYPWRGRITCHPAAGEPGTVDKTAAAAGQVAAFFGAAAPGDFGWDGDLHVDYSGPDEWSYRRFILHLAQIAAAAGGVDAFLIGSEMVGLTTIRSGASAYPAIQHLRDLAADVSAMLGAGVEIGYAADWSEYHSHRPVDGSGDVFFHLDPLWADANIDFVGIDNYLPLSDWRDEQGHLDAVAGHGSIYQRDYLSANIEGGEYYDWYYASEAARDAQTRTPITDGAYGKPWVFRNKDFRRWWQNQHFNRPGGVQSGAPTAWVSESKPIVFTELGCPAVDKASNQPNVFVDPKSSEGGYPHYSNQRRDDLIQRAYLEAWLAYWEPGAGNNPNSSVYSGRMVDWERTHLWTWDARPYPAFPQFSEIWADAPNWELGHWLTGRLGLVELRHVVADIAGGFGVEIDTSPLNGLVRGYLVDQIMSARDKLAPLARGFFFDGAESGSTIRFRHRGGAVTRSYGRADLLKRDEADDYTLTRAQQSELPRQVNLKCYSAEADYRQATAQSRRLVGGSQAVADVSLPIAFIQSEAAGIADVILYQEHVGAEGVELTLPPSALAHDSGDLIELDTGTRTRRYRIEDIGMGSGRAVRGVQENAHVYDREGGAEIARTVPRPTPPAPPLLKFLDLPLLRAEDEPTAHAPRVAAYGQPWTRLAVYRAPSPAHSLSLDTLVKSPSTIGRVGQPLPRGALWRWDRRSVLTVEVGAGIALASADAGQLYAGANLAAVEASAGRWELLQWRDAALTAPRTYQLTMLLRGLFGSEMDMVDNVAAGTAFVVIGKAMAVTGLPAALTKAPQFWKWGPAGRPTSDGLYSAATLTFAAIGLRPYAPAHLTAERTAGGNDVTLSWTRRSRLGFDAWDAGEVPLGEASESYLVEVMDGAAVKRSFTVAAPASTYTEAEQIADWGAPPATLLWRVRQGSQAFGWGGAASRTSSLGS